MRKAARPHRMQFREVWDQKLEYHLEWPTGKDYSLIAYWA